MFILTKKKTSLYWTQPITNYINSYLNKHEKQILIQNNQNEIRPIITSIDIKETV